MNLILDPLKKIETKTGPIVFLAGPISDAPSWQKDVLQLAQNIGIEGVTFLSPRKITRGFPSHGIQQMNWETRGFSISDVALFWIPNPIHDNVARTYAQTTRVELGEQLALGKKVILGIDTNITGKEYLIYKAGQYGVRTIHSSLEGCLTELKDWLKRRE